MEYLAEGAFGSAVDEIAVLSEVFIFPSATVVEAMSHHYLRSVHASPQTDCVRIFLIAVEGMVTPSELLRRESYQTAVRGYRR